MDIKYCESCGIDLQFPDELEKGLCRFCQEWKRVGSVDKITIPEKKEKKYGCRVWT